MEKSARGDGRSVQLLRPDSIGRGPTEEQRPLPGRAVRQDQTDMTRTPLGLDDATHVHSFLRERAQRETRPEVGADFSNIPSPKPKTGAGGHGRGGDAAALHVELLELRLGIREGIAIDDGDQVEGIDPEADHVERRCHCILGRHDLMAPAVMPCTT